MLFFLGISQWICGGVFQIDIVLQPQRENALSGVFLRLGQRGWIKLLDSEWPPAFFVFHEGGKRDPVL